MSVSCLKSKSRSATKYICLVNALALARHTSAFEFPSLPTFFKPPSSVANNVASKEAALLSAVSNTNNGKTATVETQQSVLRMVRELELSRPPPSDLLTNVVEAKKRLDGVWYLQYTSASDILGEEEEVASWKPMNASEGSSNIPTVQVQSKGSVNAQGITVDTSNKPVLQIFDIDNGTVTNEVTLDYCKVTVGGPFRVSSSVSNRAVVAFSRGGIQLTKLGNINLSLNGIFALLAKIRGTPDSGWLETTYLSEDIRIGRGNKGTMFVLTREADAVQP